MSKEAFWTVMDSRKNPKKTLLSGQSTRLMVNTFFFCFKKSLKFSIFFGQFFIFFLFFHVLSGNIDQTSVLDSFGQFWTVQKTTKWCFEWKTFNNECFGQFWTVW